MHLNWKIKHYKELTLNEFHDIIALRLKVFVVEQNCPYLDLDGKDKRCYHLLCRNGKGDIIATARIIPPNISQEYSSIGRVVIINNVRGKGLGHKLMSFSIEFTLKKFGEYPILISAQKHLENYYQKHNFISTGKEYLEDGIPHIKMKFKKKSSI